jgi:hypothetical protein
LRRTEIGTEHKWSRWLELATSSDDLAADYVKTHGRSARDVMIQPVITVRVDTPITEIADLLESRMIKRVFVVRDGQLVGIVSRANLIQAVASSKTPAIESSLTNDRQIRDTLLNELRRYRWAAWPTEANIIVNNGEVHLWGRIRSEEERKAMLVAARNTPGVCGVEDHMEYPQSYLVF